ncbi:MULTISPECIES: M20/M25/M40 family metallo-hydrolase [Croceibacter]|uniref:M20/M25/M40 family metallo-hydrolase n=1 Tax=Croceibacter TaxID=216431 RepID=UPI000C4A8784|nr:MULTISPECIES: M20/M25/M40 family metallo-hydrolase [Croceibacter]MBG26652.1 hypothetical protein [Croceibacter sp.]|tara:strand:+ start:28960 stop:30411 length:1452 start_codon:yes stop_codon:yes gene_type:complete
MKYVLAIVLNLGVFFSLYAQNDSPFYATLNKEDASTLKLQFPDAVQILGSTEYESAVMLTETAAHELHDAILVHGPGYIRKPSAEKALNDIAATPLIPNAQSFTSTNYTITHDAIVTQALNEVSTSNLEDHIIELQNYGTRYHNRPEGTQAAMDLKAKWEALAASYNRTDVSVRLFNHTGTTMPSVIMTITGAVSPNEYVITGGHLDTTASVNALAPGADDDASGIATITEAARVLFEIDFVPNRTIEIMAYAAEEIGLVGSAEIAQSYSNDNKNVIGVTQFDMTNFNGSDNDVYFITDNTDTSLNSFLMQLLDYYNADGVHQVTYGTSLCNYGCSDHASWFAQGYPASFPFEAAFGEHNQAIHTLGDTFTVSGTADHATKFTKLCTEFLIETAKTSVLGVTEFNQPNVITTVNDNILSYRFESSDYTVESLSIYDISGKKLTFENLDGNTGNYDLNSLSTGLYIASFKIKNQGVFSQKISVE